MKKFIAVVIFVLCGGVTQINGRPWKEVVLKHEMNQPDNAGLAFLEDLEQRLLEESKSRISPSPSVSPSPTAERSPTTNGPSPNPSASPSHCPSMEGSDAPTKLQSSFPSGLPSESPSPPPTEDPYPQGRPPQDKKGYFNYNPAAYEGPNFWGSIDLPDDYYWTEFDADGFGTWKGVLFEREPWENKCKKGKRQSPIDVRENGAICEEFHEIRDQPGEFKLTSPQVDKRIESNKLRVVYPRRLCHNVSHPWYTLDAECQNPSPPVADFPNGWRGTGDVLHIDFKIPGEHMIWGEQFNAEMQIFHVHPVNQRVVAVTTMIRAETDGFNFYLQEAINAFQEVYDQNQADCAYFLQTGQVVDKNITSSNELSGRIPSSSPTLDSLGRVSTRSDSDAHKRELQVKFVWNPYHAMLIPTIHFYRYDGSLTEPPCAEMVSWFVSDMPMIVSFEQVEQMKNIQFTNVDKTCHMTSAHFERSVARPIQPTNDRPVWKCTAEDFVADPK